MIPTHLNSVIGGTLIGLSATAFLVLNGRVAGISSIVDGILRPPSLRWLSDLLFVGGLVAGPFAFYVLFQVWPEVRVSGSAPLLAIAGLLVGFGTRLASGCTSGHGVCGLARLSPRSFVAVAVFLTAAVLTVLTMRALI